MPSEGFGTNLSLFYGVRAFGPGCEQDSANTGSRRTRTLTGSCHSAGVGIGAPVEYQRLPRQISGRRLWYLPESTFPTPARNRRELCDFFLIIFCKFSACSSVRRWGRIANGLPHARAIVRETRVRKEKWSFPQQEGR